MGQFLFLGKPLQYTTGSPVKANSILRMRIAWTTTPVNEENSVRISGVFRVVCLIVPLMVCTVRADDLTALTARAEKGDAEAQFQLGQRYAAGKEVARDDARALAWFLKAAAQDHGKAQVSLGSIYAHGFGVPQDWAASIKWYRKAALQGDRIAQHNLGLDYNYGHGVARDYGKAARWFRLGAAQGQPRCQYNLGLLYEEGKGVPQSNLEALVLYTLAAGHPDQNHIFGEAKAREVVQRRDRVSQLVGAEGQAEAKRRVAAFLPQVEVHPRRFGAPGSDVGPTRGWYVWLGFNPDTWEAEVKHETSGETWKTRVLPWATTYRHLNYGARPETLLPGERLNLFFHPNEENKRGYLVHIQDEIGQMKGHGHFWQVKSVAEKGRKFVALGMAGDKPLDGKEATFVLDPKCEQWYAGKRVEQAPLQPGDKRYLTWCYRNDQRVAMLIADDASLEAVKKQETERLDREIAAEGVAGRIETVEDATVHFLIFATHWSQAGRLKEGQVVRLTATGRGFHPTGEPIDARVTFRKNRGRYGSGVTDVLLQLVRPEDGPRLNRWLDEKVMRLISAGT